MDLYRYVKMKLLFYSITLKTRSRPRHLGELCECVTYF